MPEAMRLTFYGNPRTKKNSMQMFKNPRTGRYFPTQSKAYKAYEAECLSQLSGRTAPIDEAVNVKCVYYMETRRKVDLVNLLEATCDILVKAGILTDDNSNIVAGHDGSRVHWDKNRPRVEVTITKMEANDGN